MKISFNSLWTLTVSRLELFFFFLLKKRCKNTTNSADFGIKWRKKSLICKWLKLSTLQLRLIIIIILLNLGLCPKPTSFFCLDTKKRSKKKSRLCLLRSICVNPLNLHHSCATLLKLRFELRRSSTCITPNFNWGQLNSQPLKRCRRLTI